MNHDIPKDFFDAPLVQGSAKKLFQETGSTRNNLWFVGIEHINILPDYNVRVHTPALEAHIRFLADSIIKNGFKTEHPLGGYVVKEDESSQKIYLTSGHNRMKALAIANAELPEDERITRVPIVVAPQGSSVEDLTIDLVVSNSGKPLTPFEVSLVCKRLSRWNMSSAEIAKKLGYTESYIDSLLILAGAPPEIKEMVIEEKMSAAMAIEELRKYGSKAVDRILSAAAKTNGERITKKHMPGAGLKKVLRKEAESLFIAARNIREDKGFSGLSPENQTLLEELLAKFSEIDEVSAVDTGQQDADQDPDEAS